VRRLDWRLLAGGAVIAVAVVAAYSRTYSVPLLFDDGGAIANNASIRHWGSAFWPPITTTAGGRPVLNLSLALNFAISGTSVWSYHALNLAIHGLAALTLFGIFRRTLAPRVGPAAPGLAFSAALLWALHPLQTESVTYIVQRAESLMGLFYLLTLYCFIRGTEGQKAEEPNPGRPGTSVFLYFSAFFCLLGMATKEVMVSAPLMAPPPPVLCRLGRDLADFTFSGPLHPQPRRVGRIWTRGILDGLCPDPVPGDLSLPPALGLAAPAGV